MIKLKVVDCVRCGGEHPAVSWIELARPDVGWSHWAMCPTTNEPMMLKVGGGSHHPVHPAMSLASDAKSLPILQCPRCGGNHGISLFSPIANAPDEFDHFAVCPATGHPLLAALGSIPISPPPIAVAE